MENTNWNKFDDARPYVAVQAVVTDGNGRVLIMHRSPNVRSARDCWSFPSGLHEVGLTMAQQLAAELGEELGLSMVACSKCLGVYENISPEDKWHWVIAMHVAIVDNLDAWMNSEPDKHDEIRVVELGELQRMISDNTVQWGPGLRSWVIANMAAVRREVYV